MLQRIYGTAFFKKDELDAYLHRIEEAKQARPPRARPRSSISSCSISSSPGAAFWTERGTMLYNALVDFMRERQRDDFHEIKTPLLYNKALWEISGHWGKYQREHVPRARQRDGRARLLAQADELPVALPAVSGEEALVPRAAAALRHVRRAASERADGRAVGPDARAPVPAGRLPRLPARGPDRRRSAASSCDFILGYYESFGLTATLKFATRPEQRIGDDEMWDRAEAALRAALEATGMAYELKEGDGAFYGPKIDFDVTDSIGRAWQLGTIQLDYANARALRPHVRRRGQRRRIGR